MVSALIDVVLPVVLVAAVGVVIARIFPMDTDTVGKITLYALAPALAFDSLLKTSVSSGEATKLVGGYLIVSVLAGALAALAGVRLPGRTRRVVVTSVILGNNGNFGLPIALLALGQRGLDQAVVLFLCSVVVMYTLGPALLGAHDGPLGALVTVAKLPVTWALLAAALLRLTHLTPPVGIARGAELLAAATVPMVLLSLGIQLGASPRVQISAPVLIAVGLRVLVVPLIGWGVGVLIAMPALALKGLVLACAMPTAVNSFMIAREYGADPDTAAAAVALSTVASIVTIAVVVALLPRMG